MSSPTRWDRMREAMSLRDAMGQLLEQAVLRPGVGPLGTPVSSALGEMNILEAKGRYYCHVILPGINPEDVELTVRQNMLTLTAKLPELFPEQLRQQGAYLLQEFGSGEFSRSVIFPKDVQGDMIEAHYDRGILTIEIPVAVHAQPMRITIREAAGSAQPKTPYVEEAKPQ
jgi:HSP20 family protein